MRGLRKSALELNHRRRGVTARQTSKPDTDGRIGALAGM